MAQIRIEEKKNSGSFLPWILGLLLLALVIWGVAEAFEEGTEELTYEEVVEDDDAVYEREAVAPVRAAAVDVDESLYAGEVNTYMTYVADMEGEMGLGHEFSHRALTLLATATASVAEAYGLEEYTMADGKSDRVMRLADDIMKDPYAGDHADKIRMAALMLTDMMEDINSRLENNVPAEQLDMLRSTAQDISAETLTLNQKEDVRAFYRQASKVLDMLV